MQSCIAELVIKTILIYTLTRKCKKKKKKKIVKKQPQMIHFIDSKKIFQLD